MMINKLLIAIIPLVLGGCVPKKTTEVASIINVSIVPQKFFIEQMVGDRYQVNVVLEKGANHETYEPSPRQMMLLEEAPLYLMLCHNGFDQPWVDKLMARHPDLKVVDLSAGIQLLAGDACDHGDNHHHDHHHAVDPHIWIAPSTAKRLVENLKDALLQNFPHDSVLIVDGYQRLRSKMDSVDARYARELKPHAGKSFMVYHPATSYLARDYALNEISIESNGKEPSVARLKELIEQARAQDVNMILMQKEFDERHVQVLAQETGASVVAFDPMSENWFVFADSLLRQFTENLSHP